MPFADVSGGLSLYTQPSKHAIDAVNLGPIVSTHQCIPSGEIRLRLQFESKLPSGLFEQTMGILVFQMKEVVKE